MLKSVESLHNTMQRRCSQKGGFLKVTEKWMIKYVLELELGHY